MAWKPVALVGLAVALATAMIAVLPASPRRTLRVAEAAGSCPITIRVHGSSSPTLPSIAGATRAQFESMWTPGTTVAVLETSSSNGIADLAAGIADVAIATRPLTYAESAGKYAWQVADNVWVATRDTAAVNRIDNSQQVRADDWINFMRSGAGVYYLNLNGYYGVAPALVPPIPDWDMNLDGNTDILDLGAVASRWGLTGCYGWIRADGNNSAGVSLGDIGTVTHHWGQQGFVPPPLPGPSIWETLGGSYANAYPCAGNTADPIGTIFLIGSADAAAATNTANARLSDIGMNTGYGNPLPGGPVFTSRDNFLDNGGCVEGDITRATNGGWHISIPNCIPYCIDSRWHTRCIVHAQPSAYGYWASCTPHWDSGPPPSCPEHYVPEIYNGTENYPGQTGYDAARDWLWYQLVRVRGMTDAGQVYFDNILPRSQCGGTIFSQALTGKVNVIALQ